MTNKKTSTVFIGNVPYDTTEQQLVDVFGQVGKIESLHLVYDRDTGKPKGYGFCVYEDAETAKSAIRNLQPVEVNGRRLRIDLSEKETRNADNSGAGPPGGRRSGGAAGGGSAPLPSGGGASVNQQLSLKQVHALMVQLKSLGDRSPDQLRNLLLSNPALTHAVLQGQIMLGLVSPEQQQQALGMQRPAMPGNPKQSSAGGPPLPPQAQVIPPQSGMPPGMPPQGVPPGGGPPGMTEEALLLQQVMSMTPQQIEALPPAERQQVLAVKATVGSMVN